nr:tyrosine-type recombinase/integrase [uncultured Psychroserpens sp.]
MKNSTSVKTILRKEKKKKNGMCPLYLSIIVNGRQLRLPIGKDWFADQWGDRYNSYPKGNGSSTLKKLLENKEQKMKDYINKLEMLNEPVTFEALKEFYNGRTDIRKDFYYHFDKFTQKKFNVIKKGTQSHYLLLKKQLKEFKPVLLMHQIDYGLVDDFFFYLSHVKNVGVSGLATRRKNLITVLEEYKKLGLIEKNYCKQLPRFKEKTRTTFLTKNEMENIATANLDVGSRTNGLNLTRDKFLFSCYTGLRYSDVESLVIDEIKQNRVVKVTQKTGSKVIIPLNDKALAILKKYSFRRKIGFIFPRRCNVSVNRDLKLISRIAEIDTAKVITFHVARHTFGSTLAIEGVQPFHIMKLMGHSDIRTTSRYVNTDDTILENVMKKVSFDAA